LKNHYTFSKNSPEGQDFNIKVSAENIDVLAQKFKKDTTISIAPKKHIYGLTVQGMEQTAHHTT